MDVELPDGTLIEGVPDGMTKADLVAKLKSNGYDTGWYKAPEPGFIDRIKSALTPDPDRAPMPSTAETINAPSSEFDTGATEVPDDRISLPGSVMDGFTPRENGQGMPIEAGMGPMRKDFYDQTRAGLLSAPVQAHAVAAQAGGQVGKVAADSLAGRMAAEERIAAGDTQPRTMQELGDQTNATLTAQPLRSEAAKEANRTWLAENSAAAIEGIKRFTKMDQADAEAELQQMVKYGVKPSWVDGSMPEATLMQAASANIGATGPALQKALLGLSEAAADQPMLQLPWKDYAKRTPRELEAMVADLDKQIRTARNVGGKIEAGSWNDVVSTMGPSLATNMPPLIAAALVAAKNPAAGMAIANGGLGVMGLQKFGDSYLKGQMKGLSAGDNLTQASLGAAAEIIPEKLSLNALFAAFKTLGKGAAIETVKAFAKQQLTEHATEQVTTIADHMIDKAYTEPNKSLESLWSEMKQTAMATAIQAPILAAGGAAAHITGQAAVSAQQRMAEARDVTAGMQFNPAAIDAAARQSLDPANAQMQEVGGMLSAPVVPHATPADVAAAPTPQAAAVAIADIGAGIAGGTPVAEALASTQSEIDALLADPVIESAALPQTPAVPPMAQPGAVAADPALTTAVQPIVNAANPAMSGTESDTKSLGFVEAFGSMASGMSDALYAQAFDALQKGKNTISGVKDPILQRAKAAFDGGLIQSPADIRKFEQKGYPEAQAATTMPADQADRDFDAAMGDLGTIVGAGATAGVKDSLTVEAGQPSAAEKSITRIKGGKLDIAGFSREDVADSLKTAKIVATVTAGKNGRVLVSVTDRAGNPSKISIKQQNAIKTALMGKTAKAPKPRKFTGNLRNDINLLAPGLYAEVARGGDGGGVEHIDLSIVAEQLLDEGYSLPRTATGKGSDAVIEIIQQDIANGGGTLNERRMVEAMTEEETKRHRSDVLRLADEYGIETKRGIIPRRLEEIEAELEAAIIEEVGIAAKSTASVRDAAIAAGISVEEVDALIDQIADFHADETSADKFVLMYREQANALQEKIDANQEREGRDGQDASAVEHLSPQARGEVRPALELAGQSAEEIRADEERVKSVEAQRLKDEQAAENKRQADAERGAFNLTGSNRPADVLAAQGQKDIFSQPVDAAAHEAATSPKNDKPEPTPAQIQAGNYPKGHATIAGLDISIENPEGSTRSGTDADGKPWSVTMKSHYGYIKGTVGNDKDHVDVFVKPGTPEDYSGPVFVIDQKKANGHFDEHKIMLGWTMQAGAVVAYKENYAKDWQGMGPVTRMSIDELKAWLQSGDLTRRASDASESERKYAEIDQGFAENREAMKGLKVGDKVSWINRGTFTQADGTKLVDPVRTGTITKMQDADQGIFQIDGNISHGARFLTKIEEQPKQTASAGEPAKKKTAKKPAADPMQAIRDFYTPGNIIHVDYWNQQDKVLAFDEKTPGDWSVTVQQVKKLGEEWVPAGEVREHRTTPGKDRIVDRVSEPVVEDPDKAAAMKADADFDDALGELGDIIGKNFRATFTPEQEQKLLPVLTKLFDAAFRKGYYKFKEAARFVLDAIQSKFGADVADQITIDHLQGAYIGMAGRYKEQGADKVTVVAAVESKAELADNAAASTMENGGIDNGPDQRSSTDLERDSEDADPADGLGEDGVRAGRSGDVGARESGVSGTEAEGGPGRSGSLFGPEAPAAGEPGDQSIYTGAGRPVVEAGAAGSGIDSGSDSDSIDGSPIEPATTDLFAELAESRVSLDEAKAKQQAADRLEHKPGLASIRETLPILTDGQQQDVHTAETRFTRPDGYGMLFTNGTGTGKTFTGLGIIKRMAVSGKRNVIIAVPNDKIADDWRKSGKLLGLDISLLENTKDAGRGIVITTYANFGQNPELARREWDLVVSDEAHKLAMNASGEATLALDALQALTLHPDGVYTRARMLHADLYARLDELESLAKSQRTSDDERNWHAESGTQTKIEVLRREIEAKVDAIKADVAARQGEQRPRALFLSATPFAYEKTVDWANGYLFDYNEGRGDERNEFRGYNEGSNHDQFFMQHFGYRMRYGKLTEPDSKVDRGLMQRQFNGWLKKRGAVAGRMLDVKADYDRRFILVESAIGTRIDQALEWFETQRKAQNKGTGEAGERIAAIMAKADPRAVALGKLRDKIAEKFDYLSRRYLLEAIKAQEVVPHVREHVALGRKVVVFHDYKKGGGFNPFRISLISGNAESKEAQEENEAYNRVVEEFTTEFADLIESDLWRASSPITTFQQEFPGVLLFNGNVPKAQRRANIEKFQDDASGPQIILVQSDAGKEGISLHDTTGNHQRVLFNLGQPTAPTTAIQQEGRIYRTGQVTDAIFRYLNTGTDWEKWAFATTIAQRASAAENLGMGEQARALKDAFIAGFEESDDYRAGMDGEGKGGKERDRAANEAITEYDRARAFYFGTQKKTSKTKAQEGTDYFATPEPVGLKMMEWADIRPGEAVLEPSAGHGAIARWMPDTAVRTAIEPSMTLRSRLAMVFDGTMLDHDFEDLNIVNKYDAIVMNPPFGSGGKTAIEHVAKAARHLRDGGRIVALIPRGPAADKRFDKWFYEEDTRPAKPLYTHPEHGPIYENDILTMAHFGSDLKIGGPLAIDKDGGAAYVRPKGEAKSSAINLVALKSVQPGKRTESYKPAEGLSLVADVVMPSVTFERAGTQVATRIVVIEKSPDSPQQFSPSFTDVEDINDLFDRMEGLTIEGRAKPEVVEVEVAPAKTGKAAKPVVDQEAAKAAAETMGLEIVEHVTQKGKTLRGVVRTDLTRDQAKEIDEFTFKKDGGWFIREKHLVAKADDGGSALESRADAMTREQAEMIIAASRGGIHTGEIVGSIRAGLHQSIGKAVIDRLEQKGLLRILKTADDLPYGLTLSKKGTAIYDGRVAYLIADRMHPETAIREVLHEIGAHHGLEGMLGKEGYATLVRRVRAMDKFGNQRVRDAFATVRQLYPEYADNSAEFMHEVLANIGQDADIQAKPWWQEMLAVVKRWIVQLGYGGLIKPGDIQDMVLHSLKVASGENHIEDSRGMVPAMASKVGAGGTEVDYAGSLAMFLQEKTGTVLGRWKGKMPAADQRALFGRVLGKGTIVIDGERETVANQVKVAFGQDYDDRAVTSWRDLNRAPSESRQPRQQALPNTGAPPAPAPVRQTPMGLQGGATGNNASWNGYQASKLDDVIRTLQDKHIDSKRTVQAIKAAGRQVADKWDVYLQESLFHGRAAKRTLEFVETELTPLAQDLAMRGLTLDELDQYLHARHAEEANALIASRNPAMPDGGSGMTNQQARDYLANLDPSKRRRLEASAAKVDAIIAHTRQLYVSYGLESQETIDGWADTFAHYVPLMREDKDGGMGIGQGFSIKGKESKARTGSTRAVVDIMANIAMQRERAIVRGEKNRVSVSLLGLAKLNPNPDFWTVDRIPMIHAFNPTTGLVESYPDPMHESRENVVVAKVPDGKGGVQQRSVTFNENNEQAMAMALALKNLDTAQLEGDLGAMAKVTRYFAAINTQWNPIFGVTNLVRDVQDAMLNLSSTPIAGHKADVLKHTLGALRGIYIDTRQMRRGQPATSSYAQLWEEFQHEGGQTGYRDMFRTSADRARDIEKLINPHGWTDSKLGKIFTAGGALKVPMTVAQDVAAPIFDWLSDYNESMENAVRLSAYKVGLEQGMSKQRAAEMAKGLTVNFNRKGQVAQHAGMLYAFFNASMQGSGRIAQTLFTIQGNDIKTVRLSKAGQKIVAGGILLGSLQALMLMAAGFGDDEPPEFVRERNTIIPIGNKKYITIPMPLGFAVLPNIGRIATEFVMGGFKDPVKHITRLLGIAADAFNPIGGNGTVLQMIMPTAFDPLAAIAENKDWTKKPIAKVAYDKTTPGHKLWKDTASTPSKLIAEAINTMSGGNEDVAGRLSPTPDQIDYLFGQVTGGVGRELSKSEQSIMATARGEDLPPHKIPLVGRFYGDAGAQSSQATTFYNNINRINEYEARIKGLRERRQGAEAAKFITENPEARMVMRANYAERQVQKLRKEKHDLVEKDAPRERIKALEDRIKAEMQRFNDAVKASKQREKEAA
jgi:hypothetical protein